MVCARRGEPIQYGPLRWQKPIPGAVSLEAPAEAGLGLPGRPREGEAAGALAGYSGAARSARPGARGFPGNGKRGAPARFRQRCRRFLPRRALQPGASPISLLKHLVLV